MIVSTSHVQVLVPWTVKFTTVFYGHPDRCRAHSLYQLRLYLWLVASSLIFPLLISHGGNLIDLWEVLDRP